MSDKRTRLTAEARATAVASLRSYQTAYGGTLPSHVLRSVAETYNVGRSTLRKWLAAEGDPECARASFTIAEEHLVAIRSHLNLKRAWEHLYGDERRDEDGWVSYATFARAYGNVPAPIRLGILKGWDEMVKWQTFLDMTAPHRNHTWHLDHTEGDLWVHIGRGQIVRPWITSVRDSATGLRLAATAYVGHPNEDSICDVLATAARERTHWLGDERVVIGGLPVQLVLDNAKEHFAEAVTKGALLLGTVVAPTKAYYKNQNGQAESTFSHLNEQLLQGLPGYMGGGRGDNGRPLIAAKYAHEVNPDDVLQIEKFQELLNDWRDTHNRETKMHRLGGQVPLRAWADDPTPIRHIPDETMRAMMMRASNGHAVNTEGVRFRRINYLAPELNYYRERGLRVDVRYLKRELRYIEVFHDGQWVCRAVDRTLMTPQMKQQLLDNREKDLDLLKRVSHAANQDRNHRHLAGDRSAYDENDAEQPDAEGTGVVDETVASVTSLDSRRSPADELEPPTVERQDPTTPKRPKRSPAPSQKAAAAKRAAKKEAKQYDRILNRPGSNFGEDE